MTAPASFRCPASAYVHHLDRHMVTDRGWTLTDPVGVETVVSSPACVITWACRHVAADMEASGVDAATCARTGEAAA
jgi:hypothetical protein